MHYTKDEAAVNERREFAICARCGTWKEVHPMPNISALFPMVADYDMRFFVEEHGKCPYPALASDSPAGIVFVDSLEPDYEKLLLPEKTWAPEKCPHYRPPQTPTENVLSVDLAKQIIGIWTTRSFGAHSEDVFVFLPNGRGGVVEYWNVVFAGSHKFRWRVERANTLYLRDRYGSFYFDSPRVKIEIVERTSYYGETAHCLRVLCPGEDRPYEFVRTSRSIDGYKVPQKE